MVTKIILAIIVLHLVVTGVWLGFKLAPREGDELIDSYEEELNQKNKN
ncbi:MAG: hypothetical protein AAGA77_10255 [Bacteroidota bacterium]